MSEPVRLLTMLAAGDAGGAVIVDKDGHNHPFTQVGGAHGSIAEALAAVKRRARERDRAEDELGADA